MFVWTDFDEQGRVVATNANTTGCTPGTGRWAKGEYDDSYYMDGSGKVLKRPCLTPKVESVDGGFVVSGLPVPCVVTVDGMRYEVDDGILEWETPLRTTFNVVVDAWPHLPYETSISVQRKH